jgi:nucleotide-binding universal stress UspA family protein
MDGLRMLDEWQTFSAAVPSEETIFRRVGDLESSRAWAQSGGDGRLDQVERVLKLVDGRLTVRRVIDLSRIGTFEATRVMVELRQAGLIEIAAEEARRAPRRRASPKSVVPVVRTFVASAVPFVLLFWLGSASLAKRGATGGLPGSALPDRTVHRVGAQSESELVRQLVEIHFYETGAHPARLEEVAERARAAGHSLTPERLAAYYYGVRDGDVVLLAPMD